MPKYKLAVGLANAVNKQLTKNYGNLILKIYL